ncbi:MAG: hypothetical protein HONBIEJF_00784 [Fimbriimonadaceae bacterium]|nr:hypothetical protein [Fimbriimonadaceae bacterium]
MTAVGELAGDVASLRIGTQGSGSLYPHVSQSRHGRVNGLLVRKPAVMPCGTKIRQGQGSPSLGGQDRLIAIRQVVIYSVRVTPVCIAMAAMAGTAVAQDTSFLFAPKFQTGLAPYSIRLADVEGDGDVDVLTVDLVDQEVGTVSVVLNDGNGQFSLGSQINVGEGAQWMEVGDLNKDGRPDVLVSNSVAQDTKTVAVLMNNGTGSFTLVGHIRETGNAQPQGIEIGDFNADGNADVAVAYLWLGDVRVYFGDGKGNFPTRVTKFPGITPRDLAAADFNGDGKLDYVVTSVNSAAVFFGTNGGFVTGPYLDNFHQGECDHIVAGDFDKDGDQDFVTTGQKLTFFRNDGAGQLWSKAHFWTGENAVGLTSDDFDGDGDLDVAAAVYLGNVVSVYYNGGSGDFEVRRDWGVGLAPNDLHAGDLNGDGKLDIAAVSSQLSQTDFQVLWGVGDQEYLARRDYDTVGNANGFATADFDGDDDLDVAVAVYESNSDSIRIGWNDGEGRLSDPQRIENIGNNMPTNVIAADFNGDQHPDLAASIFSPGNAMRVWLNDGSGGFAPSAVYAAGGNPSSLAAKDLTGDGVLDVIVVNAAQTDNSIHFFVGNGDGTFQTGVKIPTLFRPNDVAIGDWDRDGDFDPLITHSGTQAVLIFVNDGSGGLTPRSISLGTIQGTPTAVDVNSDGWTDVALTIGVAAVLLNDRNGSFVLQPTNVSAGAVGVADFETDGDWDMVATLGFQSVAQVLVNDGNGGFALEHTIPTGFETGRTGGADLDADKLPELLTTNGRAGSVSVVRNTTWTAASSVSLIRGHLVAGGLAETRVSDNLHMVARNQIVVNQNQRPLVFRFEAMAPMFWLNSITVLLEAKASTVGLTQYIDLFDWSANTWVQVDARSATTVDQKLAVGVTDPARFMHPTTRQVLSQVSYKVTGPVQSQSWTAAIDFVSWKFR